MRVCSKPLMYHTRCARSWVALCLLVTTSVIGCDRGGLERAVVTGSATYRGEPIANGEIRFVPTEGTQGPISGGAITEGVYTADGLGGVPVGTYRVEIRAFPHTQSCTTRPARRHLRPA